MTKNEYLTHVATTVSEARRVRAMSEEQFQRFWKAQFKADHKQELAGILSVADLI